MGGAGFVVVDTLDTAADHDRPSKRLWHSGCY